MLPIQSSVREALISNVWYYENRKILKNYAEMHAIEDFLANQIVFGEFHEIITISRCIKSLSAKGYAENCHVIPIVLRRNKNHLT